MSNDHNDLLPRWEAKHERCERGDRGSLMKGSESDNVCSLVCLEWVCIYRHNRGPIAVGICELTGRSVVLWRVIRRRHEDNMRVPTYHLSPPFGFVYPFLFALQSACGLQPYPQYLSHFASRSSPHICCLVDLWRVPCLESAKLTAVAGGEDRGCVCL